MISEAWLVLAKDLRIEVRSRVIARQVLPFGAVVLVLFAFALDPDRGLLPRTAPGLFWIAVLLASLLAVGRSFAVEQENSARDGLRMSGLNPAAVFLGKATAIAVELIVLETVLFAGIVVLYDVDPRGLVAVVPTLLAATVGIAAIGTVYGVLALGTRVRETLVPLLVLPVVAPVMLGATRALEWALAGELDKAWPWIQLLAVFAVLAVTAGMLAFGTLLEDS